MDVVQHINGSRTAISLRFARKCENLNTCYTILANPMRFVSIVVVRIAPDRFEDDSNSGTAFFQILAFVVRTRDQSGLFSIVEQHGVIRYQYCI